MTRFPRPVLLGLVGLAALATAIAPAQAGVFGPKKKAEPAAVAAPPPPPPVEAAPPVAALPGPVLQAAGAYRAYMRKAANVGVPHAGGEIETSLETAESSEPLGLSKGAVAYAAVIALQEPTFVEGVRGYGQDAASRRTLVERLIADPRYAASMPGAAVAAAQVAQALGADGALVHTAGKAVKQSAYDMQHQAWSKGEIPNRPGRLAKAKTLASTPMAATPAEMSALAAADAAAAPGQPRLVAASTPVPTGQPYTSTVLHGMTIAALAALGETGATNDAAVQTLLNDPTGSFCHNMAKLNLYQCLAVAKPYYEDAFCLGQHVLMDTGQCIMTSAGLAPPPAPTVTAEAAPAPAEGAKPKAVRRRR